jgi:hypothetical protein
MKITSPSTASHKNKPKKRKKKKKEKKKRESTQLGDHGNNNQKQDLRVRGEVIMIVMRWRRESKKISENENVMEKVPCSRGARSDPQEKFEAYFTGV